MRQALTGELAGLRRYAMLLARDRDLAEDLVQEALVRALNGFEGFRADGDLRVWLFRILRNLWLDEHRRLRRERDALDAARWLSAPAEEARPGEGQALRDAVAALARLPGPQADAVALVALQELTYAEAAQVLEIPVGTLMSRLARGREALRRMLQAPPAAAPAPTAGPEARAPVSLAARRAQRERRG